MATSSTAVEMRLQGVDNASALLDAATQKLARLQGQSSKASSKLRDAALGAGKALLFTGPLAALRTLRRSLLATAGAAAAIGYAIDRSAARFGTLSDQAAQAGASADEITRLSNALQQAGVRSASVDTIANALGRMAKTTGRSGLSGLRETLAEIAALPDEAGRVAALSEKLGKALGPQFAALVRQGPEALLSSLDAVVAAMPGVSDAIVNAGDSVADGMSSIRAGIKNGWDELLVSVATSIAEHFGEGSFRQLGARVAAYVEYYANVAIQNIGPLWDHLKFWATSLPRIFGAAFADIGDSIHEHLSRGLDALGKYLPILRLYTRGAGALGNLSAGDWEGAWDTIVNGNAPREAGSRLGAVLGEYTGRAWAGATEDASARLAEKLAASKDLDAAMETLSSGLTPPLEDAEDAASDLGKAGAAAAKKTADAWKSAGAIMAGSYEALRVTMQRASAPAPEPRGIDASALAAPLAAAGSAVDALGAAGEASAAKTAAAWESAGASAEETAARIGDTLARGLTPPLSAAGSAVDALGAAGEASAAKTAAAWESAGAAAERAFGRVADVVRSAAKSASALIASASTASSASASGASPLSADLSSLLSVQRDGWSMLKSSLSSLGVV